jgi:hypothetical protein
MYMYIVYIIFIEKRHAFIFANYNGKLQKKFQKIFF